MKFNQLLVILNLFSLTSAVYAHNVWIEPTEKQSEYVVRFGHEQTEPYPENKLKSIQLLKVNTNELVKADYHFNNGEAYFNPAGATQVFIHFDNGIWSQLPNGKYVEKSKKEAPDAVLSLNPVKFGKTILLWNDEAYRSHHMEYELIPTAFPKVGEPLPILVLHQGKPVKGIKVGTGESQPFNLTNQNGVAIFVPTQGNNKVWAEFAEKATNNADYSQRKIEYMLTFDVQ